MNTHADDSFGNLVPVANPYGFSTTVYMRINGKLAQFIAGTRDHVSAIDAVRKSNNDYRLSRSGKWRDGPCLAVINGGRL
jgi:hypothetical protein